MVHSTCAKISACLSIYLFLLKNILLYMLLPFFVELTVETGYEIISNCRSFLFNTNKFLL